MMKTHTKISTIFTLIIITLSIITSLGGIFSDQLYRDNDLVKTIMFGNDIITLFMAIPLMIVSFILAKKGSTKWTLIWLGTLWYMIYNYIFYVYALAFNKFFLLYVFIFILSGYAIILGLINLDIKNIRQKIAASNIPFKKISAYMLFFAVFIGGMWIVMSLSYVFTNEVPEAITKFDHPTSVVFSTDLAFLVSPLIAGALLLWKKNIWGYIISSIIFIKCLLYPVVLLTGGILAHFMYGTWDSMIPGYLLLGVGCATSLQYLLKGLKTNED